MLSNMQTTKHASSDPLSNIEMKPVLLNFIGKEKTPSSSTLNENLPRLDALDFSDLFKDFDSFKDSQLTENALDLPPVSNTQATNPISSTHQHTSNIQMKPVSVNCIDKETSSSPTLSENTPSVNICNVCNKNFRRRSFLEKHKKFHAEDSSCKECLKTFLSKDSLKRHQRLHNKETMPLFKCDQCGLGYTRKDQFNHHVRCYQNSTHTCIECNEKFCKKLNLKAHIRERHTYKHPKLARLPSKKPCSDKSKILKRGNPLNMLSTATFKCLEDSDLDISEFLNSLKTEIENELLCQLNKKHSIKYFLSVQGHVTNSLQQENAEILTLFIDSNVIYIFSKSAISEYIDRAFSGILQQFLELKAEWTLKKL